MWRGRGGRKKTLPPSYWIHQASDCESDANWQHTKGNGWSEFVIRTQGLIERNPRMPRWTNLRLNNYIYFITTKIKGFVPLFRDKKCIDIIIDNLNHYRKSHKFLIIAYIIMPEHLHLLILPYGNHSVSDFVRDFKKYTAKRMLECLKARNAERLLWFFSYRKHIKSINSVWEEGFVSLPIYTEKIFDIKLNYLHFNPVKKGYVKHPKDYLYSSYSEYYLRKKGPLSIDKWR